MLTAPTMKTNCLLLMLLFCCSLPLFAQIRITEFMYSSNNAGPTGPATGPGEFVELTNVGTTSVNLTGWSFDDNSRIAGSFLIGVLGTLQPGESAIITDATEANFRAFWALAPSLKILGSNTQNLGRSDEINIFDGSGMLVDRLTFDDQGIPNSPRTQYVSAWATSDNLGTNRIATWVPSRLGDALNSKTASTGDIGNPGHYFVTPVCTNPPTIQVATTTTKFISLTAGFAYVSGVMGDPTDPASTLGIDFLIADSDTDVNSLTVTATSNNTNVSLILAGTGATRTLKITPTAVGYAVVTVTVSDGNCTATYVLNYAGSAASVNQTSTRFHTGSSDASTAVPVDGTYVLVADDEGQTLRLYDRANSGLPLASFDFTTSLQLTDQNSSGVTREVDIEASIRQNNRIFWFGSQSNNDSGEDRPNRNRVFATDITGSGASTSLAYAGRYDALKTDIINWDATNGHGKGANYYGLQASTATGVSSKIMAGYNIEGAELAPDGTTAYIAFRAPQVLPANRQKALIIPVTNLASLVTSPSGSVSATFGAPIELDLGGRGIREIRKNTANQYVIIAGPAGETGVAPNNFRLYTWTGNASDKPVERTADLTALMANGSFESIVEVPNPLTNGSPLQFLVDNGDADYYNDGKSASKLEQNTLKKFRSDLVTLGAPVNTAPTVASAIPNQTGRINQPFSYTVLASTFTDAETPNALTLTVAGLPTGLSFASGIISGTPSASGVSTLTVTATDPGGLSVSTPFAITVNPATILSVGTPTYNCLSRELTINTTAGDGSLIEYQIEGVAPAPDWTDNSTFVLPASMRFSPSLTLMARQSEREFTVAFSPKNYCALVILKPTYDCRSGLLTINTTRGTGAPIEYKIAGIASFNLNQTVVIPLWIRTDANRLPLILTARQSGQETTYEFNTLDECPVAAGKLELVAPAYNCGTGALKINTRGGNTTPVEYMISGVTTKWSANATFSVPASTRKSGASLTLLVRQSGVITSAEFDLGDFCYSTTLLEVITPAYSCSDGTGTIKVQGGNNTAIEYSIPGVRNWATSPKFTLPLWIRTDEMSDPLMLLARQSGVTSSFVFELNSLCPVVELIRLLAPTYDCKTGELTFNVSTGNGSLPIEYMISGVTTKWSKVSKITIPVRYRTNPDLLLMARQGGVTANYVFDLQEFCGGETGSLALLEPSYTCKTGALSLYTSGGNGNPIEYMIPGVRGWSKNPNFIVSAAVRNNPNTQPLTFFARQSGEIASKMFDFRTYCDEKSPFDMTAPSYVCQSGRLTLYTTPGTGGLIEYMIPGIRDKYATSPNITVPAALRNNPNSQPLTLFARQNGVVVSSVFHLREFCQTGTFTVQAPTYSCTTGKLTINTSGGSGSLIEYMIPDVRGWSANRTFTIPATIRNNPNNAPLTLVARQGGVLVNSTFTVRSVCGSTARQGAEERIEPVEDLQLQVLGNPVKNEAVVEIRGAVGQLLTIRLADLTGQIIETRSILQTSEIERVTIDVSQQPTGILILQVLTDRQSKAVRLLKQ